MARRRAALASASALRSTASLGRSVSGSADSGSLQPGAAVGEAGLAGAQLKLLSAGDTGFDGKGHTENMVAKGEGGREGC